MASYSEPIDKQVARLERKLHAIRSIEVPRAASKALSDTARVARTRAIRGIAKAERLKPAVVRKKLYVRKSTAKTLVAKIRAYREGISAIALMTKAQVRARLASAGKRRRGGVKVAGRSYPNAFVADGTRLSAGTGKGRTNKGILRGTAHVLKRTGTGRYPLEVVKVPIKKAVDRIVPKTSERELRANYPRRLVHELRFRIKKYST